MLIIVKSEIEAQSQEKHESEFSMMGLPGEETASISDC